MPQPERWYPTVPGPWRPATTYVHYPHDPYEYDVESEIQHYHANAPHMGTPHPNPGALARRQAQEAFQQRLANQIRPRLVEHPMLHTHIPAGNLTRCAICGESGARSPRTDREYDEEFRQRQARARRANQRRRAQSPQEEWRVASGREPIRNTSEDSMVWNPEVGENEIDEWRKIFRDRRGE